MQTDCYGHGITPKSSLIYGVQQNILAMENNCWCHGITKTSDDMHECFGRLFIPLLFILAKYCVNVGKKYVRWHYLNKNSKINYVELVHANVALSESQK